MIVIEVRHPQFVGHVVYLEILELVVYVVNVRGESPVLTVSCNRQTDQQSVGKLSRCVFDDHCDQSVRVTRSDCSNPS